VVAAGLHRHALAGAAHHHDVRTLGQSISEIVDVLLERHDAAAAIAAVRRHHDARLGVVHAVAERLGREAAEHHAVGGADARARQHRDRRFRDHRQIDADAVARLDAEAAQHVGEPADLAVELEVGEHARSPGSPPR
jgi:hypothetical protein